MLFLTAWRGKEGTNPDTSAPVVHMHPLRDFFLVKTFPLVSFVMLKKINFWIKSFFFFFVPLEKFYL